MAASPFPRGLALSGGDVRRVGRTLTAQHNAYWLHALTPEGRVLIMTPDFHSALIHAGVGLDVAALPTLSFGGTDYRYLAVYGEMDEISRLARPMSKEDALPFARALAAMPEGYSGAVFCRDYACMLSVDVDGAPRLDKALVLGRYLSGGIEVSAEDIVALDRIVTRLDVDDLEEITAVAGVKIRQALGRSARCEISPARKSESSPPPFGTFRLPGRNQLEAFFNDYVIDVIANEARYAALGIGFPGGIILEGPTGCGKTYAVEKLVDHLGWKNFSIDATSIASPYIHETSRKIADIFAEATKAAPAVIVIDEMDAFLTDRDVGNGHHRIEEVAEFLRRIPGASAARVLVIGMTNKIDLIDPAILRRGRFDHVIRVDHATPEEIEEMLASLLRDIPHGLDDFAPLSRTLARRPLSDVAHIIREAGRLAARKRKDKIGADDFDAALARSPSRSPDDQRKIGFR
ncbi:ATP-binding protein [Nguyenibacter vanlangensis]|uniref:ATP-binding protein n=1 Tax=Nguyenibacter vanlangensis TaxID=1216886 RepID=A0ABZ3D7L6_9PROT